jgi:hypothetical protein
MATLTWTHVRPWLSANPHTTALKPFKAGGVSIQGHPEVEGLAAGWTKKAVAPATPLSAILLAQDVLYNGLTEEGRRGVLRDETTDLQEKSVLFLKGRQWPIRRTAEGIVAAGLEEGKSWPDLGWEALCVLRECQLVLLNEDKRSLSFYPADLRTWRVDTPIYILDHEVRYLHKQPASFGLGLWLSQKEGAGWSIAWPVADGTVVELKTAAEKVNETVPPRLSKDALTKRVGRAEAVHHLAHWSE